PDNGEGGDFDLTSLSAGGANPDVAVSGSLLVQGDREGQLLEREWSPVEGPRLEPPAPLIWPHPAGVLEADAQQFARGLVEEDQVSPVVDQECRSGEVRREPPGHDQLNRMLMRHSKRSLPGRAAPDATSPEERGAPACLTPPGSILAIEDGTRSAWPVSSGPGAGRPSLRL